ncbi:hypothetical protein [Bradyrhizobium sp. CB2312]|uniref:hypothetical protein n=1 Tax=Bradyrhizobium sp. CB2312 TaxID=3039155 RepID=UPI0024B17670|nr:hypothetical protein [Bradyrhizobium sp. CB2312]WFU70023.1 hypothetical protein QA642_32745 [Bradyrhizobium sp. CB2312]
MGDETAEPARKPLFGPLAALLKKDRPVSNWAQIASACFAGASFALALGALGAVLYQVTLIKNNAAIASARQVFMEYSKAGIKYPMFADPDYKKLKAGDATEFARYKLFVTLMLWAYDEMLLVYDDPEWRRSFENDIDGHREYICAETKPGDFLALSRQMRKRLTEVRSQCRP